MRIDTVWGLYNDAVVLLQQNSAEISMDAMNLLAMILLGANHVSTLHTLNNLGSSYEQHDRFSEAMVLYKECFKKRKIVLGCSHPETVRTMTNIALINILQNNYSDEAKTVG